MCSMSLTVVVSARWNADFRKDVGRGTQRRQRPDDEQQQRQHHEGVRAAQRDPNQRDH
jgi:hypothetical protein